MNIKENLKEAEIRIEKALKQNHKSLDLSNLGLISIPKEVKNLVMLEELDISRNQIGNTPNFLEDLTQLKVIKYNATTIQKNESEGYIKAILLINEAIQHDKKELDLSSLNLDNVPKSISNLKKLEVLDVSDNNLLRIPSEVYSLSSILEFHYSGNEADSKINIVTALCKVNEAKRFGLDTLDLSELGLQELPKGINECINLKSIDLYGNFLTEVDQKLIELKKLQYLFLSGNRIRRIPKEIGNLNKLRRLSLYGNLIEVIPVEIGKLINLEELELSSNQISELPNEIGRLKNLKLLSINDNLISEIPHSFNGLKNLDEFDLSENQFNLLAEVYRRKPIEIIKYLLELQKESKPLHEAKVIFIGSGFVGKTSLVNKILTNQIGSPEKTNGIEIRQWNVRCEHDNIKLNIWDFGGQEIMHATHKFFMTNRTIYVLVTSPRIEDKQGESGIDYWLKLVQSYTLKENVPIIIAVNKCDVHKVDLGKQELKQKYPNIIDIIETSCTENLGIAELKMAIKNSITHLPHVEELLPTSYFKIKEKLETINKDYIQYNDYKKICRLVDRNFDDVNMTGLVGLLHDLGIMLNFNSDRRLYETQVLNPEWVTNGVYQIITSSKLIENKGKLNYDNVEDILDDKLYPSIKEKSYILDIMERFELCFQFENQLDHYFIPGAFPMDPPKVKWNYDSEQNIKFIYQYDVLPASIISRFMVKVHKSICGNFYWRNGVVITRNDCFALIKADKTEKRITIEIDGDDSKRDYLSEIRLLFDSIHSSFGGLQIKRLIPVVDNVFVSYDDLLIYEESKEDWIFIPDLKEKYNVKELLNGIEKQEIKQNTSKMKKIFLSYSHKDESWKDELATHLISLERQELISSWNDRMIKPGEEWEREIYEQLDNSEIVLMLISSDFISSEFCYSIEMKRALDKHEKGSCTVIPIIVRACNWTSLPFGKLQALPKDGKPVSMWSDKDDCLNQVIKSIVKIL